MTSPSARLLALLALTARGGTIGGSNRASRGDGDGVLMARAFSPPHAMASHHSRAITGLTRISRGGARHDVGDVIGETENQYDPIGDHNVDDVIGDMDEEYATMGANGVDDVIGGAGSQYDAVGNDRVADVIGGSEYRYEPVGDGNVGDDIGRRDEGYESTESNDVSGQARGAGRLSTAEEFDAVVNARYACTRFQRHREPRDNVDNSTSMAPVASLSDPTVVENAHRCLALSQRAPTGFNAQPYRVILVHSREGKERLAQYCLGRNADRVRDSDCTAVFLADRECGREGTRFESFLVENMDPVDGANDGKTSTSRTRRQLSSRALFKLRMLILLFSSGYPLPRFLSVPLSFGVRLGVSVVSFFARCVHSMRQTFQWASRVLPNVQLLPTLSSAETWSQKNTMLVAMTYMLACTSRGLATCPMEGFDAAGVRKVLGIPRGRYGIPLIVCAGTPYRRNVGEEEEADDVGLSHGASTSPRFPLDEVVFGNAFGKPCSLRPAF